MKDQLTQIDNLMTSLLLKWEREDKEFVDENGGWWTYIKEMMESTDLNPQGFFTLINKETLDKLTTKQRYLVLDEDEEGNVITKVME